MRSQKYLWCFALVLGGVFFFSQTRLQAQVPGMPKLYGQFKPPEAGAYVTYKVFYPKNNAERIVKLSIVSKEKSPKGEDLYWFEQAESDPKTGEATIVKMLISGNPQDIKTMHRMIMKSGKEPAQELPADLMEMINQVPTQKEADQPKVKNLGPEKVKIKNQTWDCTHERYTYKDKVTAEVWRNSKVPIFGMVKSTNADATFELIEYGTNAVSAIKEQPQILDQPPKK